ncbi:hypothetical protein OQA88_11228 [Cercophora sp. LCS_1]
MVSFSSFALVANSLLGVANAVSGTGGPLLGVSKTFTVNAVRNEKHKPNGPAEYARALARWNIDVPEAISRYSAVGGKVGSVGAATVSGDREYISMIGLGTPPQKIPFDLDTGSSDLWVFTNATTIEGEAMSHRMDNRTIWNIEGSSTAARIPNSTWSIQYGDGSFAYGDAWKDTVTVDGIEVKNAVVESAAVVSDLIAYDQAISGIFGLAYKLPSEVSPEQPTVLEAMGPLLEEKVISVDLKYLADGSYTFGKIDKTKFKGDLHYIDLIPEAQYWQFNFTGFHTEGANSWYLHQWAAIADTGTSLLLIQEEITRKYYGAVEGANNTMSYWTFPCDAELPDFEMGFGNWSMTIPGHYVNYTYIDEWDTCMGGIQSARGQPFSILGDIFLKAVYIVFDFGHARVGLAEKA